MAQREVIGAVAVSGLPSEEDIRLATYGAELIPKHRNQWYALSPNCRRSDVHKDRVSSLIHLYEDGALNRRELMRRLTQHTGTAAAALAIFESSGLAQTTAPMCPAGVQVSENDPAVLSQTLTLYGEGGPLFAYQSLPRDYAAAPRPAVLVIHENRGLNDHIKDVTRRVAKAGYVAIAVDLLSRQGGTSQFTDPEAATAAYNRTTPEERRQDMLSTLLTIRDQIYVTGSKLGVVGFCAGGGNVWDLVTNTDQLSAAVVFYGPPAGRAGYERRGSAPADLCRTGPGDYRTHGRRSYSAEHCTETLRTAHLRKHESCIQ